MAVVGQANLNAKFGRETIPAKHYDKAHTLLKDVRFEYLHETTVVHTAAGFKIHIADIDGNSNKLLMIECQRCIY